jgi:NAD(P)-dependent dehydrogenase (short-subunit alcohol dehydrogenase family)
MRLDGKKVVVIGDSFGIVLAIARLARAASLIILGGDPAKVSGAASTLGGDTRGIVGDAHDHPGLGGFVAAVPEFDDLVAMIGDTMAGGFLDTALCWGAGGGGELRRQLGRMV